MVDPWFTAGLTRPPLAPEPFIDPGVVHGQVPLVEISQLVAYLTIQGFGLEHVIETMVSLIPELGERLDARLIELREEAAAAAGQSGEVSLMDEAE
ncbi:MAG: hypothetical protein ABIJ75_10575 [Actinomycetota bacterium]